MPDALKVQPYPGYAWGRRATGHRCPGCRYPIGHGTEAIQDDQGWWHRLCHESAHEVEILMKDPVAVEAIRTLRARGYSPTTVEQVMRGLEAGI